MQTKIIIGGREISEDDLMVAEYVAKTYKSFSRKELARTLCYCQDWVTIRDVPKLDLGAKVLEYLEGMGRISLPAKREQYIAGRSAMKAIAITEKTDPGDPMVGDISSYRGIEVQPIFEKAEKSLWKEYMERYHPEKYAAPRGTNLRYAIKWGRQPLGCMMFSPSAWALEDRDKWIGWTEQDRSQRLVYVLNSSRFLLLPWIRIHNLASWALGQAVRRIKEDWLENFLYAPVLLETFIDPAHYKGSCYKAAGWQKVGTTKGRGRHDRRHEGLSTPREIYMYPLEKDFRDYLLGVKAPITREEVMA